MKTSQTNSAVAVPQPRLWPQVRIGGVLGYAAIWAFFGVFLIYPLIRLFYDAFTTDQGQFTLMNFYDFFTDSYYLKATMNSLLLGVGTVMTTSILGIAIAYLLLRYEFRGRELFSYLTIIPMIMPPLVGVMGFVFIMGRAGTVNILLMDYLGFTKPINFMYGIHGVLLVETLHLFPLMTLSIVDALARLTPLSMRLQRASDREVSGSSGTLPSPSRRQATCLAHFSSSSGRLQILPLPLW
jgi:iron(III) transport system permease protein